MTFRCPQNLLAEIKKWAEGCYPYEGCALLLGHFMPNGDKRLDKFVPIPNLMRDKSSKQYDVLLDAASATLGERARGEGLTEFLMDPQEFNRAALAGEKEGLDVVGIMHTHPDHPARPSAVDDRQPLLAVWSNVIVRVDAGRFVEARSWARVDESSPFIEESIVNT